MKKQNKIKLKIKKNYFLKKKILFIHLIHFTFKKVLHYNIKKGHKYTLENIYKKIFFLLSKKKIKFKKKSIDMIIIIIFNLLIYLNLQVRRRGRRIFYQTQLITKNKRLFYLNSWLHFNLVKKGKKKNRYHVILANEIFNIALNKNDITNKAITYNQLLFKNIRRPKKKNKKKIYNKNNKKLNIMPNVRNKKINKAI